MVAHVRHVTVVFLRLHLARMKRWKNATESRYVSRRSILISTNMIQQTRRLHVERKKKTNVTSIAYGCSILISTLMSSTLLPWGNRLQPNDARSGRKEDICKDT